MSTVRQIAFSIVSPLIINNRSVAIIAMTCQESTWRNSFKDLTIVNMIVRSLVLLKLTLCAAILEVLKNLLCWKNGASVLRKGNFQYNQKLLVPLVWVLYYSDQFGLIFDMISLSTTTQDFTQAVKCETLEVILIIDKILD